MKLQSLSFKKTFFPEEMSTQEVNQVEQPPEVIEAPAPKVKKPKRKCSQKQLAALAAGRAKNKHFKPKAELN